MGPARSALDDASEISVLNHNSLTHLPLFLALPQVTNGVFHEIDNVIEPPRAWATILAEQKA